MKQCENNKQQAWHKSVSIESANDRKAKAKDRKVMLIKCVQHFSVIASPHGEQPDSY